MFITSIFTILITAFTAQAHVPEEGMVWATAGPLVNHTFEQPQSHNISHRSFYSPGLIVEGDTNKHGGLELGFLVLERQYYLKTSNTYLAERVTRAHIPAGYRYWFNDKFSLGLAFYSSYRMGDVVEVSRPAAVPNTVHTSAAEKITEYGFDLSGQWEPFRIGRYAALVDGRYSHPINAKPHESAEHYTVLVGLKYLVQHK